MKLKFERDLPQDSVLVEPDGTVFTSFMKTGHLKGISRTKYASGNSSAVGAFMIPDPKEGDERPDRLLVFVTEGSEKESIVVVERFATADDAHAALSLVRRAVSRYVVAQRRRSLWRTLLIYGGAPLLIFMVATAGVRFLDSHNGSWEAISNIMRAAGTLNAGNASSATLPQVAAPVTPVNAQISPDASVSAPVQMAAIAPPVNSIPFSSAVPQDVAPELARQSSVDIARAITSIHFGLEKLPPSKTLYVYSDPACPACRRFEPHLDDLAKDFSIYVIPVAYQQGSTTLAAQILCSVHQKQKWSEVMAMPAIDAPVSGMTCDQAYAGIKADMQEYESLGFKSTPRVVSGTGAIFPEGATAEQIRLQAATLK